MDGRRARLIERPVLDKLPTVTRSATKPAHPAGRQLTTRWAAILGVGWPLALMIAVALEPTPAEPEAAVPLLVELASVGLYAALLTTAVMAARRLPAAPQAGVVTGLIAVAFSITCPLSGHHAFGLWWIGQLGVIVTMLGISLAALGRRSSTSAGRVQTGS
jgi:hypothetical protein